MKKTAILLFLISSVTLSGQTAARIESLLAKISTYQYGGDPAAGIQLEDAVGKLSGSADMRKTAESLLLKFVQSNATPAGKEIALRQLSLIGSPTAVPVLAPMLTQIDTAEMARYALTAIPGAAVDEALRRALSQSSSDRIRIGIINSLGRRGDEKSVPALASLTASPNAEVIAAAVAALASIADRPALEALAAARRTAGSPARELVSEAFIVCADHFAERGDKAAAVAVYKEMIAVSEPATIRARALKGLTAADSKTAVPVLVAELQSNDPARQVAGIRLLNEVPSSSVTKTLITEFPKLSAVGQIHLLSAVASRGDVSAKPAALSALKSSEPAVRAAGLTALGRLADESSIKMLAEAAASGQEPELSAARRSLYTLRGSGIDAAIVTAIGSSNGKVKTELIMAAGERASARAADALTRAAQESDPEVRREALRALRNVGGAAQTQALLDLTLKSSSTVERRDATQTLATVLRRAQPAPLGGVISAYNNNAGKEARLSLLEVMGQTSSAEALPLLRAGIKDPDPEIARGAILALTGWDNPTPLPDLLNLAKGSARSVPADPEPATGPGGRGGFGSGGLPPTNNLQILALRGVLRLILLPSQRSVSENGALLSEAMRLASQVPEKRTILSLLPSFPSKESLEVARTAIKDPAVTNEAKVALDQVDEALKIK